MTSKPSTSDPLFTVRGTELLASDSREQYRQKLARITLDSMVQFVGLLDAQGIVLEINQVALDAVGVKLSEVEGKPFWTTFWWQVSDEINAELREMIRRAATGEFVRWDTEIFGRAGGKETIIIDASLMPVKDEQGNVVFITAEGRDITEKKAHEREIARQREELAQLDKLKTQFFANISHEFRTPLTLMMGPLDDALADRQGLSADNRERLMLARRNSARLLKLVNTLLDFSRMEAGRVAASYEPVDLSALTSELASVFRAAVERAGVQLVIDCPPLPEPVYVDREMWEKVVLNLLSNAFKFTFEGEIEVSLRPVGSSAEMTVRDTGTGIPPEELPRLFERFHRVKGARGRSYEGSGIGLALVQDLVKLHGGSVRVESKVDAGSSIIVSLPMGKAHLPQERIQAERSMTSTALTADVYLSEAEHWLPNEAVLMGDALPAALEPQAPSIALPHAQRELVIVADDNADMREYVSRLLADEYRVLAVEDGQQAVEATREHHPALLLTDVMMPRLDGFAALQAIRNDPAISTTPVILLSARAGEESRMEGLEAGADDYLVKPFTARELVARVTTHVKIARVRRDAERARRLYDTILSNTPDLAYVFDLDHRFIYANKALLAMWGRSLEDSIGKNCLELGYEPWHAAMHDREIEQVIATRKPIRGEVPFIGTNGRHVYDYIFVPVFGPGGEVEAIAGTTRDVTERKIAEEALRRSEKLAATGRLAATMAHEINNPLEAVTNLVYLARAAEDHDRSRSYLATAEEELERVSHLTKQTLGFYRETKGVDTVDLSLIVKALLSVFAPRLRNKRVEVETDIKAHPEISAVPGEIRQLIANLLSNSIDAVDKGGRIRIRISSAASWNGDRSGVRLTIADNGPGIPPEIRPRLFEPFVTTKKDVGTGLGLWVCKSIVERHGGKIRLKSSTRDGGSWTAFALYLPAVPPISASEG